MTFCGKGCEKREAMQKEMLKSKFYCGKESDARDKNKSTREKACVGCQELDV